MDGPESTRKAKQKGSISKLKAEKLGRA